MWSLLNIMSIISNYMCLWTLSALISVGITIQTENSKSDTIQVARRHWGWCRRFDAAAEELLETTWYPDEGWNLPTCCGYWSSTAGKNHQETAQFLVAQGSNWPISVIMLQCNLQWKRPRDVFGSVCEKSTSLVGQSREWSWIVKLFGPWTISDWCVALCLTLFNYV